MRNIKKVKILPKKDAMVNKISFSSGLSFVLDNDELLKIEKTNSKHIFGIAVDLGTVSICVSLCNLQNNQEVANAVCDNHREQAALFLTSRNKFRIASKKNQKILTQIVLGAINKALDECIRKSGVNRDNIYIAVLVGSPIMRQIFLSIPLSVEQSLSKGIFQVKAAIAGIKINPAANIKFIPGFDDNIGSDILASIVSLNILKSRQISLCIDLGTRAKIIIGNCDGVFVGSAAISSVFEGRKIKCGMVTQSGAIEWARINAEKVDLLTIGHIRPQGICGSGIIDIVSEMINNNILRSDAQMLNKSFILYEDKKSRIEITEQDIKKIQQAKAAVAAAIIILMKQLKLKPAKIKKVYISGQLGDYLNVDNLVKIGLISSEFKHKAKYVGNSALLGTKLALLSKKNLSMIIQSAEKVKHIYIESDKSFKTEFTRALPFRP